MTSMAMAMAMAIGYIRQSTSYDSNRSMITIMCPLMVAMIVVPVLITMIDNTIGLFYLIPMPLMLLYSVHHLPLVVPHIYLLSVAG